MAILITLLIQLCIALEMKTHLSNHLNVFTNAVINLLKLGALTDARIMMTFIMQVVDRLKSLLKDLEPNLKSCIQILDIMMMIKKSSYTLQPKMEISLQNQTSAVLAKNAVIRERPSTHTYSHGLIAALRKVTTHIPKRSLTTCIPTWINQAMDMVPLKLNKVAARKTIIIGVEILTSANQIILKTTLMTFSAVTMDTTIATSSKNVFQTMNNVALLSTVIISTWTDVVKI